MYELLGVSLALAAILVIDTAASVSTAMLWRALRSRASMWPAARRAQWIFALRVLPAIFAVVCVVSLLLPAYIANEPREAAETVSWKLGALAAISAAGLSLALWRGAAAWFLTQRLVRNWLQNAEPIALEGVAIPAYRLRHPFPVVAIVGAIRPRMFIADSLFDSLSREELAAAIAHECGHLKAHDTLKCLVLRTCSNALIVATCGRSLDRAWSDASEAAADEYAARTGASAALDLAAALVKIARLAPQGIKPAIPTAALLIGEDVGGITRRVIRLTRIATQNSLEETRFSTATALSWSSIGLGVALALLVLMHPHLLAAIHHLIETAVSVLQ